MTIECFGRNSQGFNVNPNLFPCGNLNTTTPSLSCCIEFDICMSDGFCFHTYSSPGETGYYIPGCTTVNKNDPACIARCIDQARPDVVWNSTSNLWHCCGTDSSGTPKCDSPTDETFAAPAPSALVSYFTIASGFTATSTSIIGSSTFTDSATTSVASLSGIPPKSSAGVSTGTAVGIGIGCAFAGIILTVAFIWFLWHIVRRKHDVDGAPKYTDQPMKSPIPNEHPQEIDVENSVLRSEIGPGRFEIGLGRFEIGPGR